MPCCRRVFNPMLYLTINSECLTLTDFVQTRKMLLVFKILCKELRALRGFFGPTYEAKI